MSDSAQTTLLVERFGMWSAGSNALQNVMPWLVNQAPAYLTTHASYDASYAYRGTLVTGCNQASCSWTPYISDISHTCSCSSQDVTVTTTIFGSAATVVSSNQGAPLFGGYNESTLADTYLSTTWLSSQVDQECVDPRLIWYWMREERLGKPKQIIIYLSYHPPEYYVVPGQVVFCCP